MKKKKKRHSLLMPVLITGGVLCLLTLLFIKSSFTQPKQIITEEKASPEKILPELAKALEVNPSMRASKYWNWVDKERNVLPLDGQEFFIGSVNTNGVGKYGKTANGDIEKFTLLFFQPIGKTADSFFITKGFRKSNLNSYATPDEYGVIVGGYEKDSLKCLYSFMEKSDPFGRFFCGYIDQKQIGLQKEFQSIFPLKYTPGTQPTLLRIEKQHGDFILGNYAHGSGPEGYTFMAKKTNGNWNVVWKGQEIAVCSEMRKYQIPKQIYDECYPD